MYSYLVNLADIFTKEKEERIKYKNLLSDGPIGSPAGIFPTVPTLPAAPASVTPGILVRLRALVQRIKKNANYTEAIGRDLGIIGAEQTVDRATMQPKIKLVFKGGQVEVQWTKGDADAIRIEKLTGTATTFSFLAVDTVPHYTDTTAITVAAVWKYRAIYLYHDQPIGQYSDVAQIAVG